MKHPDYPETHRAVDACVLESWRAPASHDCDGHEERIAAHQRRVASAGESHECSECGLESPPPAERGPGWVWQGSTWLCPACAGTGALHVGCLAGCGRIGIRRGLCTACYNTAWKRVRRGQTTWGELIEAGLALPVTPKGGGAWGS